METDRPDRLHDLQPRAKLVYLVLEQEGRLDQKELSDETRLAPRTVRRAVNDLDDAGLLEEVGGRSSADGRRYEIAPGRIVCGCSGD